MYCMLSANFIGKKSKGEKYFLLLVTSLLFYCATPVTISTLSTNADSTELMLVIFHLYFSPRQ